MGNVRAFGTTPAKEPVSLYLLSNGQGMTVGVTDLGATLVSCSVPNAAGEATDVLLGYDDAAGYLGDTSCLGFLVGRNANRIANATFSLDGRTYQLEANDGPNNLHSGSLKWAHRMWEVLDASESSVTMRLESPAGDQGFPGSVTTQVTYRLTEQNELWVSYRATPSEPTIINLTCHGYWNLNGHDAGSVTTHMLQIEAERYTPMVDHLPTGEVAPVEGTPYDFRTPRAIGACLDELPDGYDDNFCFDGNGELVRVAHLCADKSGIAMEVRTDAPGMQIYTDRGFSVENGKGGAHYGGFAGLAIETQFYPDAINHADFPQPVFTPEHPFVSTTVFAFGAV